MRLEPRQKAWDGVEGGGVMWAPQLVHAGEGEAGVAGRGRSPADVGTQLGDGTKTEMNGRGGAI